MSNHFPRRPINQLEHNQELLKSQDAGGHAGGTDYRFEAMEDTTSATTIVQQYRTPADREAGWLLFRRYPNGDLDLQYAVQKVVDSVRLTIEGMMPNMFEQIMLSCFYPQAFTHPSVSMASTTMATLLRISPEEHFQIIMGVNAHFQAMYSYSHGSHSV